MEKIENQNQAYELRQPFAEWLRERNIYDVLPENVVITGDTVENFIHYQNTKIFKQYSFPKNHQFYGFKFYDLYSRKKHIHIYLLDVGNYRLCYIS